MRSSWHQLYKKWHYLLFMAGGIGVLVLLALPLGRNAVTDDPAIVDISASAGPPWRYGRLDARFTLIEYADLECPYCQAYFPELKRWIDANPDVNWQWHHLPLPMHEPAATHGARLAECAGESGDREAFWSTISWVYQHTLGNGRGLPPEAQLSRMTPALHECLASTRPDVTIRMQVEEAAQDGIAATPTLRVIDNQTGKSLLLPGSVEGDILLSALDLLASSNDESLAADNLSEMPADPVSDMPR
jgi:protein-disulfide isomerase